ncbi:E1a_19K [Equine adenovirus 2]|uniref:E1B protein, small T-antigen n=1 Tax=Equine adenovirus B serotype 2 TaxID=67603 RepID=A0A0K1DBT8_ADEE2|nr:E1a_19K [Equine adenovirus 2]AKT26017.1 E1a_19K [Equine adenovirus 2]
MDLMKLLDFKEFKRCVYLASNRCRWWEKIFCTRFIKFVRQIKKENFLEFAELILCNTAFSSCLKSGQVSLFHNTVLCELDFSNPGRVVTNLAFLSYLIDMWDQVDVFSHEFILESVCFPAWQRFNQTQPKGVLKSTEV